jgi:redox-sensitive bicupin YhaK (pirin superfamily)
MDTTKQHNQLQCVVSPDGSAGVTIHQNAWFHLGNLETGQGTDYALHGQNQGAYVMVLEGEANVANHKLGRRDAVGIADAESFRIEASADAKILVLEVPMQW